MDTDLQSRLSRLEDQGSKMELAVAKMTISMTHIDSTIEQLVTKDKFAPVAYIAYGLASGVFMSVLGAVLTLVILRP